MDVSPAMWLGLLQNSFTLERMSCGDGVALGVWFQSRLRFLETSFASPEKKAKTPDYTAASETYTCPTVEA